MKKISIKNKSIISIFSLVVLLLATISVFLVYSNNKTNGNIGNVEVYKRTDLSSISKEKVNLTKEEETKIKSYLNKESLEESKKQLDCMVLGKYTITFNSYEISFDDKKCASYLYDKEENKKIQVDISSRLRKYVIKIANKGEK